MPDWNADCFWKNIPIWRWCRSAPHCAAYTRPTNASKSLRSTSSGVCCWKCSGQSKPAQVIGSCVLFRVDGSVAECCSCRYSQAMRPMDSDRNTFGSFIPINAMPKPMPRCCRPTPRFSIELCKPRQTSTEQTPTTTCRWLPSDAVDAPIRTKARC